MTPNYHPAYHFRPARDWMNDPNGLIEWDGQTHLFYQYTPGSALSGLKYWGHAVSRDRVRWQHEPVALAPTPGGPDAGGCWSGCAVDDNGVPTFIYTGVDPQVVCLATSRDGLRTWQKHPANPVIAGAPPELAAGAQNEFRDPYVWREGGAWHLVLGCMQAGQGGLILRYRSADLVHWDYVGVLFQGDLRQTVPFPSGTMWECPNYYALEGQRVLVYSAYSASEHVQYPVYYAASTGDQPFSPHTQGILAYGPAFYAPHGRRLGDGRTMMWGWLKETCPEAMQVRQGWSGVMSLPLALAWLPEGALGMAPAEELKTLRGAQRHLENLDLAARPAWLLDGLAGGCLEIEVLCQLDSGAEFSVKLSGALEHEEQTRVSYQAAEQRLVVDTRASSLNSEVTGGVYSAPLRLEPDGRLHLRIFLDRSVLEVFANGRVYLAARLYPMSADSLRLDVSGQGGAHLKTLDVWQMAPIWDD